MLGRQHGASKWAFVALAIAKNGKRSPALVAFRRRAMPTAMEAVAQSGRNLDARCSAVA